MKKLAIAALLVSSATAQAGFYEGNDLIEHMREYEKVQRNEPYRNGAKSSLFQGYVSGVHDRSTGRDFCDPPKVTDQQVVSIVVKYINAHPERWSEGGAVLVVDALKQAFPCVIR